MNKLAPEIKSNFVFSTDIRVHLKFQFCQTMKYCVVKGCKQKQKKGTGIQFHRFPFSRPEILQKWIEAIGRDNWSPKDFSNICSRHFISEDYQPRPNAPVRWLKEDAVPTIFEAPEPTSRKRKATEKVPIRKATEKVPIRKATKKVPIRKTTEKVPISSKKMNNQIISFPKLLENASIGLKIPIILKRNKQLTGFNSRSVGW